MTNQVSIFKFENSADIRVVSIDGNPWFVATDVCKAIGLTNVALAVRPLNDDEKPLIRLRQLVAQKT